MQFPRFNVPIVTAAVCVPVDSFATMCLPVTASGWNYMWFSAEDGKCRIGKSTEWACITTSYTDAMRGSVFIGAILDPLQCFVIVDVCMWNGAETFKWPASRRWETIDRVVKYETNPYRPTAACWSICIPSTCAERAAYKTDCMRYWTKGGCIDVRPRSRDESAARPVAATVSRTAVSQTTTSRRSFIVSAGDGHDVYHLADIQTKQMIGVALVQSTRVSKHMNRVFHNIRAVDNLDLLEMSDDEDDAEDSIKAPCIMSCVFNTRFKKWELTGTGKATYG